LYEYGLIARRQQAFVFDVITKVDFSPTNFQQTAGFVCYYHSHKFHYLYISMDEAGTGEGAVLMALLWAWHVTTH